MTITALIGTANVRLTCMIQLTNDIGPDYSALSVSWLMPVPAETESVSPTPMTQKEFKSTLNIPLIMKGQYCCNALSGALSNTWNSLQPCILSM